MKHQKLLILGGVLALLYILRSPETRVIYLPCPDKEEDRKGKDIICGSVCGMRMNYRVR